MTELEDTEGGIVIWVTVTQEYVVTITVTSAVSITTTVTNAKVSVSLDG